VKYLKSHFSIYFSIAGMLKISEGGGNLEKNIFVLLALS